MHDFDTIVDVLREEAAYQDKKHGGPEHDKHHDLWDWIQMMLIKTMEARNRAADPSDGLESTAQILELIRETTMLGIAAMKAHGYVRRYESTGTN